MGYEAESTKLSNDQGADLIATKFGGRVAIQAKHYNGKVGNKAIQEVSAASKHYKTDKGMVITTGRFTKSAIELAESNNVEIVDGDKLNKLIKDFI